jgi:hypothetical protein
MQCRIAALLAKSPSELDLLPARDIDLLVRYWEVEPWGEWRAGYNAAQIAREVRRSTLTAGQQVPPLITWMYTSPDEAQKVDKQSFFAAFRQMAGGMKEAAAPPDESKFPRPAKSSYKRRFREPTKVKKS